MYDTLLLFAPVEDPARLVAGLEDVEERFSHRTGEATLTGRLHALHVKTSGSGVIVSGSLSRYWFGSNVMAPDFSECREALRQLEGELGASLDTMRVFRLDIAATLNVKYPCTRYLRMFGELPRFKRLELNGGLLYRTNRRELGFYDKRAEARHRKQSLPKCFTGRHALRYELRYRSQLKGQFGEEVTGRRLIASDFFREIVRRWERSYHAIRKQEEGALALQLDTTSPKSLMASLAQCGVEHLGGEAALLAELGIRRECGEIDRLTYSRQRAKIMELCRRNRKIERGGALAELEGTIGREADRLFNSG